MKRIAMFIALLIGIMSLNAQAENVFSDDDLWGASYDEVSKIFQLGPLSPYSSNDSVAFANRLSFMGVDMIKIECYFYNDQFYAVIAKVKSDAIFGILLTSLTETYGEPTRLSNKSKKHKYIWETDEALYSLRIDKYFKTDRQGGRIELAIVWPDIKEARIANIAKVPVKRTKSQSAPPVIVYPSSISFLISRAALRDISGVSAISFSMASELRVAPKESYYSPLLLFGVGVSKEVVSVSAGIKLLF